MKYELQVAQESLALTNAVVQDSALESEATGLPNARYLDIWIQGHMHHARRNKESLGLALWAGKGKLDGPRLRKVVRTLRGNDLLVELSPNRFLLLLSQTLQDGATILLERLAAELGNPPMGATLWMPDRDDLLLHAALRRAESALQDALKEGGSHGIRWKLPTLVNLDE
jgi:GGDEF domain-containing protein